MTQRQAAGVSSGGKLKKVSRASLFRSSQSTVGYDTFLKSKKKKA